MYQIEAHDDIWRHKEILYVNIINIRKIKVLHCHVDWGKFKNMWTSIQTFWLCTYRVDSSHILEQQTVVS